MQRSRKDPAAHWPRWRGPLDTGEAVDADPPVAWSADQNIAWKKAIPGHGLGTPVIWGDQIFLTSAEPVGPQLPERWSGAPGAHNNRPVRRRHRFLVMAIDRRSGKMLWKRTANEMLPHAGGHETGSLASASAATNGRQVVASFGSYGLYAFDRQGTLLWQRDLGRMQTKHGHGEGASPALYGRTVVVNHDHEGQSYIAAFDAETGRLLWKKNRDEKTSWATPIVIEVDGATQVVVAGSDRIRGYDLKTGRVIWSCRGTSDNIVASPVHAGGVAIVGSSYGRQGMVAVRLAGASGDLDDTDHLLWRRTRRTPYVPSPLFYEGRVFIVKRGGIASCFDARTGEP
ncbi:MAG: PQQ-binding-like beta-propeller repeat protein, partial [Phycisphaeraceae bacterium]|nr:PQQ-binding-like beta-propeller repeat protein [Phycisphaeraceae bacterium]